VYWPKYFKKTFFFALSMLLLTLAGAVFVAADLLILHNRRILPNIHVADIDIGGLTYEQAKEKLTEVVSSAAKYPVMVTDQTQMWPISSDQIGLFFDIEKSVAAAFNVGRGADFFQRWKDRLDARKQALFLPVSINIDKQKFSQFLKKLSLKINREPRNASLSFILKTKTVSLIPAVEGRILDIDQTIQHALATSQFRLFLIIDLKFLVQLPIVTDKHFAGINSMLSLYSTHFKPWDYDRNANLRLATQRIHGTILKPGVIFSYNEKVGNRTQQQGFRMAPVIFDGKLIPDWGGGVCQVSSTLYNSVLMANLDIIERINHGRTIGYVPLGFDATVVDGQIDFRFINNLSKPIMLYSVVTDNELFFAVLGDASNTPPIIELDYVVYKVIEPIEIKQPDPTLEIGKEVIDEPPQRGFKVATYRIRTINGKEERQLLSIDDYDPVNKIIKIGSKPKTQPLSTVR